MVSWDRERGGEGLKSGLFGEALDAVGRAFLRWPWEDSMRWSEVLGEGQSWV